MSQNVYVQILEKFKLLRFLVQKFEPSSITMFAENDQSG